MVSEVERQSHVLSSKKEGGGGGGRFSVVLWFEW